MSLLKLCEIIDSGNYEEFVKFFNQIDHISEDCITLCADFIFNPFKEEYFKILCGEVFNKTHKNMPYILNKCASYNNLKAVKLLLDTGFNINNLSDSKFNPLIIISGKNCIHSNCENSCEYENIINYLLDNDFNLCIDRAFISAIERRKYCVCRILLKYGYTINYSDKNIMEIIYSYISDETSLQFLLNECDLQINFSNPFVIKHILLIIGYYNSKVLSILINNGLNLHDLVSEINNKQYNKYFINTLNILKNHDLDTETICKLMHGQ
ncbi:repeat protein [Moumouvirus goulette]|uniref:Repeat protein n=1 Tax=Moumouvirus goulette TaxID=1247379 RepID=M1PWA1_9VIRU|nr:repeat protein [Moumouvirus goulette]AGF85022.1 repeat protein [Moumouvirus goulette]